jgi:trans-aconitate 2-methyltransferase
MPWNPEVYNQFKEERYAPFYDLCAMVQPKPGLMVIDLGCGTGELTGKLAAMLPGCMVTGIDSSAQMLQQAGKYTNEHIVFKQQAIEDAVQDGTHWDIVFSNAALHWVDGHNALFAALVKMLRPGGQLAVQMPSNHTHATHRLIQTVAATQPFKAALNGWSRETPVLTIDEYAGILYACGGHNITVFEKAYPHVLNDAAALARWTQGTTMVPYMERLPVELKDEFLKEYTSRLQPLFTGSPVFYPFKRILMYAVF